MIVDKMFMVDPDTGEMLPIGKVTEFTVAPDDGFILPGSASLRELSNNEVSITLQLDPVSAKNLERMLLSPVRQHKHITRKRFIKLLMGAGKSRNFANKTVNWWNEFTGGAPYWAHPAAYIFEVERGGNMRKLDTVRKSYVLNNVYSMDEPGPGGAHHEYVIIENRDHNPQSYLVFQKGARYDPKSEAGITDEDLLEIVRDRLKGFQQGEFACEFNERALRHINEALYQLKLRAENRAERGVLGKMVK